MIRNQVVRQCWHGEQLHGYACNGELVLVVISDKLLGHLAIILGKNGGEFSTDGIVAK